MINIAVDGPSGSGKSSLAKTISKTLGILYLDTGALYRAIGYTVLQRFSEQFTEDQVCSLLPSLTVDLRYEDSVQHVYVNGEDVSPFIRTQPVAMAASKVSAYPRVREFLLALQRNIAAKNVTWERSFFPMRTLRSTLTQRRRFAPPAGWESLRKREFPPTLIRFLRRSFNGITTI